MRAKTSAPRASAGGSPASNSQRLFGADLGLGVLVEIDTATGAVADERGTGLDVAPQALAFVPGLPDAVQNKPYEESLFAGGGRPPLAFGPVSGLPGVENLRWQTGSTVDLEWDADPGGEQATYSLFREPDPLGSAMLYDCLVGGIPAPEGSDLDTPDPGRSFFYLATGQNSCGSGSAGFASDGTPRSTGACP